MLGVLTIALFGIMACNTEAYTYRRVVDCAFSVWTDWMPHSSGSFEIRTRDIMRQARNGGQPCVGDRIEYRSRGGQPTVGSEQFMGNLLAGNTPSYSLGGGARYTLSRDIVLALDSAVDSDIFPYYKSLVSNIVGKFCGEIGNRPQDNRITLAAFDSYANELHTFTDNQVREEIQNEILKMRRSDVPQSTLFRATDYSRTKLIDESSGVRLYNNATKEVLIVTTYREYCNRRSIRSAERLTTSAEVYVIVLGRGNANRHPRNWCLEQLASDPQESHLLQLDGVTEIAEESRILLAQSPINNFCRDGQN